VAAKIEVRYPPSFPGVNRAWWYLREGFERIGCNVIDDPSLLAAGHWSPPNHLPDPVHIAVLEVNGQRVWYDCSDFVQCHPYLGQPYFAKNMERGEPALPLGQYLGSEPQLFFEHLPRLRLMARRKTIDVLAVFSNIDEPLQGDANVYHRAAETGRNVSGLRRKVVERLKDRPGVVAGLWRWNHLRPEVPPELRGDTLPLLKHWERIAQSKVVICLPGVGGDSTRLRTEALAIGSFVLTVESEQAWPGDWSRAWHETRRDLVNLETVVDALVEVDDQREDVARNGRNYFDEYLTPEAMAKRVVREVT